MTRRRMPALTTTVGIKKAPTGIAGFDHITRGGLPHGGSSLVTGGPGCGKTIFALHFLMHGARECGEPGVFVAFEEDTKRLIRNASALGWNLPTAPGKTFAFMDAQPATDLIQSGDFDLAGMLGSLTARIQQLNARRIVFDGLDVILDLLPDQAARRREIFRVRDWLLQRHLTALVTAKSSTDDAGVAIEQPLGFMQFMVDCSIILKHGVNCGVSQRNLRIQKYRGSAFDENEAPFIIDKDGFDVAISYHKRAPTLKYTNERVTSGVDRLDSMLGGGYYRGASVLITGFPGTAKTTLSGAFAAAACRRGERTIFISFDSDAGEVVRNLRSVNIRLDTHVKSGLLNMVSARSMIGSAETLMVRIKLLAREHRARCMVIDPVSTFAKAGNEMTAHSVAERLIEWTKSRDITLLCTSLLDETPSHSEGTTPLPISTLTDTWLHVNYVVQAGERNRGISIIKSRGTMHSNQVRELILRDSGVTLADIYTAQGEVLMGTRRWEKENAERAAQNVLEVTGNLQRVKLKSEEAELRARVTSAKAELAAKRVQKLLLDRDLRLQMRQRTRARSRLQELRADRRPDSNNE